MSLGGVWYDLSQMTTLGLDIINSASITTSYPRVGKMGYMWKLCTKCRLPIKTTYVPNLTSTQQWFLWGFHTESYSIPQPRYYIVGNMSYSSCIPWIRQKGKWLLNLRSETIYQ